MLRADEVMVLPETGLVAGVKQIHDKPDEIKRLIRAGIKANRYIRANRDGTVQFLTEWLKLNKESAAATYNEDVNVCDKGLRTVIDETKKTMKLSRDVSYSEVADLSILRDTQRELAGK